MFSQLRTSVKHRISSSKFQASCVTHPRTRPSTILRQLHSSSRRVLPPRYSISALAPIPRYPASSRLFSSHNSRTPSTYAESFPDPDRPDLFYHLFHPPTELSESTPVFALSFLPDAPMSVVSRTVVGWLPASAAAEGDSEDGAGLNDFRENPAFRELLHEALQSGLKDDMDDIQRNGAIQTQQGWMHINDDRNIPALGRIADPDDILASVRVEEGKMLVETYQPMPSYRLCTTDGILKLTEGLAQRLKDRLEQEAKREKGLAP